MPDSQSEFETLMATADEKLDQGQMQSLLHELSQVIKHHLAPFNSSDK